MPRGKFDRLEDHVEAIAVDECVYDEDDVTALHHAVAVLSAARHVAASSRSRSDSMQALRDVLSDMRWQPSAR